MAWDYPKDYRGTKIIIEQVLKEYNEEHPIPPIDSQDPYSPDLEALMQLDIDLAIDSPVHPPSQAVEDQPSVSSQALQNSDQAGPSSHANLQDLDS
ncbi:hypothetical protein CDL15_Pgr013336 [Punica granatum]|uniref:Uncharacterized protein n=1 Tax=Punica granatum TaxID=22663 RepID=A0A218WR28_PUNGR|nr:hypothetical protein CDL15_Pgr013336 [Punica granatum]